MTSNIFDTGRKGDLTIKFGYMEINGDKEPTMQIINYGTKSGFLLPLPLAFQYINSGGNAVMERATSIAERIYGFVTKDDVRRIADVIYEWVGDLISMPPPKGMTRAEFEESLERHGVEARIDGQRVI